MKGKGKGERGRESSEMKECPLQYPDLTPVDHLSECSRYSSVLRRSDEDSIGIEELDGLQVDLETLLAAVAKRMRQLETQIPLLTTWLERGKIDKKSLPIGPVSPTPPTPSSSSKTASGGESPTPSVKRSGKGAEEKPNKKLKDSLGRAQVVKQASDKTKAKVQGFKSPEAEPVTPAPLPPESPSTAKEQRTKTKELPKLPKNDTPNRFWAMVEPYCQEITTEDLKVLEDILKTHEDDAEYYKIPSLGKHYSHKWAVEDLNEEQRQGSKLGDRRKSGSTGMSGGDGSSLLHRLDNDSDDGSPFGPLTQRLVQALMEENIMTPIDDTTISEADAVEAATISPRSLAKQLNLGNTAVLERRIKRELEEHGILEAEDHQKPDDDPGDEILAELKKKQAELKALSQHNFNVTKRLYKLAKDEIQRQELRKKMATADADVMDAYRRIQATRQKKKTPSKKEKEQAYKALKERESVIKALEALE